MGCGVLVAVSAPIRADNRHDYTETGKVISVDASRGVVYGVETADKIYEMLCRGNSKFYFGHPRCQVGGKAIARDDTVRFRIDGDMAFISAGGDGEARLAILSTELKVLPPIAAGPTVGGESGVVLGKGMEMSIASGVPVSPISPASSGSDSSSGMASGPVIAVPVTGGPPVPVIPVAPSAGGTVTGVPVTGGAPVTAVPVTPISTGGGSGAGVSAATPASAPIWIHFLRVQTSGHVYDLACASKTCTLKRRQVQLGDSLTIRIEKKKAVLFWPGPGSGGEQKFAILRVRNVDDAAGTPPH